MEVRWINYQDLVAEVTRRPERFTPWMKIYLAEHSDRIFGPDMVYLASLSQE
jgi:isopentenyl-diphosphate delta-isomerase